MQSTCRSLNAGHVLFEVHRKTLPEVGILAVVVVISQSKADFEWQSLYAIISANRQLAGRDRCPES
jgi:hypothetical protein